jgi:hypothetical protein
VAYQIGTAASYKDLLYRLRAFACDSLFAVPVAGSNTGNGTVRNVTVLGGTAAEVWTLTATSATNFTVSSSLQGAHADATVGTAYDNTHIKFLIVAGAAAFVAGDVFTLTITASTLGTQKWTVKRFDEGAAQQYTGTGNGTLSAVSFTETDADETWTLKATSATNFNVVSSAHGSQSAATVGTPYTGTSKVGFTINAGSTPFVAGDTFVLARNELTLLLCGPGTAGADEIHVGIQTYSNPGVDYYNWKLQGFTGYSPAACFKDQPGAITDATNDQSPRLCLWNQLIPYWLAVDGRHIRLVAKVSTVYEPMYLGYYLPYGLPNEFPYPLAVGGSRTGDSTYERYSAQDDNHRGFIDPANGSLRLLIGSTWLKVTNYSADTSPNVYNSINVWPFVVNDQSYYADYTAGYKRWRELDANLDGSYPVFPLVINGNSPSKNIYGELQGCFAVPGLGLSAEDTLGADRVVFQNTFRNGVHHFWVFKLE